MNFSKYCSNSGWPTTCGRGRREYLIGRNAQVGSIFLKTGNFEEKCTCYVTSHPFALVLSPDAATSPKKLRDLENYAGEKMAFEQPALEEEPALDDCWPVDAPFEKASTLGEWSCGPPIFLKADRSHVFEGRKARQSRARAHRRSSHVRALPWRRRHSVKVKNPLTSIPPCPFAFRHLLSYTSKLPGIFEREKVWSFLMGVRGRANTPLCAASRASIAKMFGSRPSNKVERVGESAASSAAKPPSALLHQDMLPELLRLRKYFDR